MTVISSHKRERERERERKRERLTDRQTDRQLGLVEFYGMSTIVGYLMLNPFLYIFQTIHFSIRIDFVYSQLNVKNSSISNNLVLLKYTV